MPAEPASAPVEMKPEIKSVEAANNNGGFSSSQTTTAPIDKGVSSSTGITPINKG